MSRVIVNPDREKVREVKAGLAQKGGFCPCKVGKLEENRCPCKEFRETKHCHCQLFLEVDN